MPKDGGNTLKGRMRKILETNKLNKVSKLDFNEKYKVKRFDISNILAKFAYTK